MIAFLAPPWSQLPADGMAGGNDYLIQDAVAAISSRTGVVVFCRATSSASVWPDPRFHYLDFPPLPDGKRFGDADMLNCYAQQAVSASRRLDVRFMIVLQPSELVLAIKRHAPTLRCVLLASSHHLYRDDNYHAHGALPRAVAVKILAAADSVLTVSNFLARRIGASHPFAQEKITTLPQGVSLSFFSVGKVPGRGPRVLYVGRLEPAKGVHVLVDAFEKLRRKYNDATLTIVGEQFGPGSDTYYDELRQAIAHRRCAESVYFTGWVGRSALPTIYSAADIFVHPAVIDEPFASTVLEAMACGLPIVATNTGGTSEAIRNGITGVLVPPDDSDALAGALDAVAGNPEFASSLAAAARRDATANYTWDRFAVALTRLFE
jgi:glycosyltransferase involved in cell wall biosynthesis